MGIFKMLYQFLPFWMQSGPHDFLLHCLIQQNKKASIFYLYLSPNQGLLTWRCTFTTRLSAYEPHLFKILLTFFAATVVLEKLLFQMLWLSLVHVILQIA